LKNILIVGDVHGQVNEYYKILQKYKPEFSIQVGDFGFKKEHEWFLKNIDCDKNRINFGNHDDISFVSREYSLGNYTHFHQDTEIMTVRGADSIDKQYRTEGISWWRNEEFVLEKWAKDNNFHDRINEFDDETVMNYVNEKFNLEDVYGFDKLADWVEFNDFVSKDKVIDVLLEQIGLLKNKEEE